jgi:uncharacterized membrane-anchored protein
VLTSSDRISWFLTFSFDDTGYVKDDEKTSLNADAILSSIREGTEQSNEYRRSKGWSEMHISGWSQPPAYDPTTHNLCWAISATDNSGEQNVNYNTRVLGRRGVMSVNLVTDPETLTANIATTKQLLTGLSFKEGEKYSQWVAGDKVAAYGLTGLITGGLVVGAAKTGLLAKLFVVLAKGGKAIVVGILAIGAAIWKFAASIFGGRQSKSEA